MTRHVLSFGALGLFAALVACASGESSTATGASDILSGGGETGGTRGGPVVVGVDAGTPTSRADAGGVVSRVDGGATAPLGCYAGLGTCEPTNPTSCAPGQTCDINGPTQSFLCFDPPNDAQLGDPCNNASGPFCAQGLACAQGFCVKYCCDDSLCNPGTTCTTTGTLGGREIKFCL